MDRTSSLSFDSKRTDTPASHLRRAYEVQRTLFQAQPPTVQRFLESQSLSLARAITQDSGKARFILPDQVLCEGSDPGEYKPVPLDQREQSVGGQAGRIRRSTLQAALSERLAMLEKAQDVGVATSAALLRYTVATSMVRSLLPSGRTVSYQPVAGDEIPNQPVVDEPNASRHRDSTAEEANVDSGMDELMTPYVPEARRFYLPQWVAFDERGQLLVNTVGEARAHIASMQKFMAILRAAASLAPYILADAEYQQKRYGIMGQLVNQGRLLARFETGEIIQCIRRRAKSQALNRGLSLSLPYFDDQDMELKNLDFTVIPAGWIMFVPAFLVLAVCEAQAKVSRDNQMSASTRQYLLAELKALEKAFDTGDLKQGN